MTTENQTVEVEETKTKAPEKALADFGWDASDDFFGIKDTGASDILEDVKEENPIEKVKEPAGKEKIPEDQEDLDMVPFAEVVEEQKVEGSKTEVTQPVDEIDTFTNLAKDLIDRKILNLDIADEEEINEERFFELQAQEIETRAEEIVEAFAQSFDEEGAAFIRFKKDGGTYDEFRRVYSATSAIPQNLDLTDENDQDRLLRFALKKYESLDNEDIEDKLEWLEEKGKKLAIANKYEARLKKEEKENKTKLLEAQKAQAQQAEIKRLEAQQILKSSINEAEQIKDFPITKKDKTELFSYMTKPVVKVSKGNYLTQMQADLQSVYANEGNKLVLLAKLLKSDFDVKDIKKKAVTVETKAVKSRLKGSTARPKAYGGSGSSKSLADFFS